MTFSVVATMGMIAILPWAKYRTLWRCEGAGNYSLSMSQVFSLHLSLCRCTVFSKVNINIQKRYWHCSRARSEGKYELFSLRCFGTLGASLATALGLCVMMVSWWLLQKTLWQVTILRDCKGILCSYLQASHLAWRSLFRYYHTEHGILQGCKIQERWLCLFNLLCLYRSWDFPGRNDEMEFIRKREWVLIQKEKTLLRKFSEKEENDETR